MSYLASTVVWVVIGIAIGVVIGFVAHGKRAQPAEATAPITYPTAAEPATPRGRPSRLQVSDGLRTALGLLMLGLVGFTVYQGYASSAAVRALGQCETDANRSFQEALASRSAAAKASNDAQRLFLTSLSQPGITPERRAAAMATYLDALNAQDRAQDANPLVVRDCG